MRAKIDYAAISPDTGCDESPKCVLCPLPECKFEVKEREGHASWHYEGGVRADVQVCLDEGMRDTGAIARKLGVSLNTAKFHVGRILSGK